MARTPPTSGHAKEFALPSHRMPHSRVIPLPRKSVAVVLTAVMSVIALAAMVASPVEAVNGKRVSSQTSVTLWGSAVPATPASAAVGSLELGSVIVPRVGGKITHVRFYKAATNTGTHVGNVYDAAGKRLASVTFTGETASGWQQAALPRALTVSAGSTYTVSYTTSGHSAADAGYFAPGPYQTPYLKALRGVYKSGSGFPTLTSNTTNYYADVRFNAVRKASTAPTSTTSTSSTTTPSSTTSSSTTATSTTSTAPSTTTTTTSSSTTPTAPATASVPVPSGPTPILDYYKKWSKGPQFSASQFPIGVWMQDPTRQADTTSQWKALGVNTYVGVWSWPTDAGAYPGHAQDVLNAFGAAGAQALANWDTGAPAMEAKPNGSTVRGHILADEPDMNGTTPAQLASKASAARAGDPNRPTYVNFSKGIVNGWNNGVAVTAADKRAYCASADIASVDYYGFTDPWEGRPGAVGYAEGMDALKAACGNDKPLWGFVETTRPFDSTRITPAQYEVAVWTLLASGADGIELFIHDFGGGGGWEDALLRDSAAAAVKARVDVVSDQIAAVAPLLNQADATASSTNGNVRVLGKTSGAVIVNMATTSQTATLTTPCGTTSVTLASYEHRTISC